MHMYGGGQPVELSRNCQGIVIPDGIAIDLHQGETVYITQVLGGMFTVETERGYLVRIDGLDADALLQPIPPERQTKQQLTQTGQTIEELVWSQLRTCYDPEIPVNIVELGLIYGCQVGQLSDETHRVEIQMTLTAPGCGMGEILQSDVEQKVLEIPNVASVHVEIVFDPPWDANKMSEAARLQLGMM